jgi:hypothetical protein
MAGVTAVSLLPALLLLLLLAPQPAVAIATHPTIAAALMSFAFMSLLLSARGSPSLATRKRDSL